MLNICVRKRTERALFVLTVCVGIGFGTSCRHPGCGNGGAQFSQELRTVQKTFQSLWECSDFVVIAVPIFSKDTGIQDEVKGFGKRIACTGILTTFSGCVVLKGDTKLEQFSLFHYQEAGVGETVFPDFARFKVQEPVQMAGALAAGGAASYLLYLKAAPQEPHHSENAQMMPSNWVDYIPATGQELSGLSVYELHWSTTYDY